MNENQKAYLRKVENALHGEAATVLSLDEYKEALEEIREIVESLLQAARDDQSRRGDL